MTPGAYHIGKFLDPLLQGGVLVNRVLPDLIGPRLQIDLAIPGITIEQARLLGEQIAECAVGLLALKERLVGANYLGVLSQPLAHPATEIDDPLDAIGNEEGVTHDRGALLPNPIHSARPLDEADDRPR